MQPDPFRAKSKSPGRALMGHLVTEAGLNPAQCRVVHEALTDHMQAYFTDTRPPGAIVHTAVSAKEPAGKPIKDCVVLPVRLTMFHETDPDTQQRSTVELRTDRVFRFCTEARDQGALLSYEDLAYLLCVDVSTIKDCVRRLRERGLFVPTRGAVKDIGPQPSHKVQIAGLLGRGFTTSRVASMTCHSEHAVGRYQAQFGLVLYLLHTYPNADDDELRLLSNLGPNAWRAYVDLARELLQNEACLPHLERLRRRYQLDPDEMSRQVPQGKRPQTTDRLEQQTLATAIRQTVQDDLALTTRVAQAVTDDLLALVDNTFLLADPLRPGEAVVLVDAHDPSLLSGEKLADRPVIPVRLPLHTPEIQEVWRGEETARRRRATIAVKLALAASEQGGVMTVTGLAELLHVAPNTMARDLRDLAVELHVEAPTKGLIEDAGPTLTHKDWIVDLDHHGLTGEEITWLTRHAPASRDRYIETYRRAESLMRLEGRIPTAEELARVLRLRQHVAAQYVDLLGRHHGDDKPADDSAPADQVPF